MLWLCVAHLAQLAEANLQHQLDLRLQDLLWLSDGKHPQDYDRPRSLVGRDLLIGAFPKVSKE